MKHRIASGPPDEGGLEAYRRAALVGSVLKGPLAISCLVLAATAHGDLVLDGSIGGPAGLVSGDATFTFLVEESLGQASGDNLFFSFSEFAVEPGEAAHFSATTAFENVFARVTSADPARIDGGLSASIGEAALWMLSPSGIVVGDSAAIDVSGGFVASTADVLRFSDGTDLRLADTGSVTLSASAPFALRFLEPAPAALSLSMPSLEVGNGSRLDVIGSGVQISGLRLDARDLGVTIAGAGAGSEYLVDDRSLSGPSSDVTLDNVRMLIETAGQGGFALAGSAVDFTNADVRLVSVSDVQSGPVSISARTLRLGATSTLESIVNAEGAVGADVTLAASESIVLSGVNTSVGSFSLENGATNGTISLSAPRIRVEERAAIDADQERGIGVRTGDLLLTATEQIELATRARVSMELLGIVEGGTIRLSAPDISLTGRAVITADSSSEAPSARVELFGDRITIDSGAVFAETSSIASPGIQLAGGEVRILNDGFVSTQAFETGPGGPIEIQADTLFVGSGGRISASSTNVGRGGDVTVRVTDSITLDGTGSEGTTGIVARAGDRDLEAILGGREGFGVGDGGSVSIAGGTLRILDGAVIAADTTRSGNAGSIEIQVGALELSGLDSGILAETDGTGRAGAVVVSVEGEAAFRDGAALASTSRGSGDAGTVTLEASRVLLASSSNASRIASSSELPGGGGAGQVRISAAELAIEGLGVIATNSAGDALATDPATGLPLSADVVIDAGTLSIQGEPAAAGLAIEAALEGRAPNADFAGITSDASGAARGGNLVLSIDEVLAVDAGLIGASSSGTGGGGNILIGSVAPVDLEAVIGILNDAVASPGAGDAPLLDQLTPLVRRVDFAQLQSDGAILARAVEDNGGNIVLVVDTLLQDTSAIVNADSALGNAGTVAIDAPEQNLNAAVSTLDVALVDASDLIRQVCDVARYTQRSSLTVEGSGGVPPAPSDYLSSPLPLSLLLPAASGAEARETRSGNASAAGAFASLSGCHGHAF